jgi:hypothetical protein
MRSAIDILQQAFQTNNGSFDVDKTRRNPAEELQTWVSKQKAIVDGSKPKLDCLRSAAKDFSNTDIETLLFRYERCLPYLLEKNMMAHSKTTSLLEYCANQPPTNLRFWRGLLSMYFSFDRDSYLNGIENWRKMRQLIAIKLDFLVNQAQGKQEWISYLSAHRDLLTDKPGVQFAEESLRTGRDTTTELKEKLDIPQESWFWKQYLLTKISVAENSRYFENTISGFIDELKKQQFLAVRSEGIKQLLEIYQRKGLGVQAHQGLLEFAVEYWKAPYKNNHADWLRVNDVTYQMVLGWYTRKRLNEFIDELRGSNHVQDDRLDFWVNYSQSIGGRFFILMGDDFSDQIRFKNIANKYPQNFGTLSGARRNNVFIFDFITLYAVVSSESGNALYLYNKHNFPAQLRKCDPTIFNSDKNGFSYPDIGNSILKNKNIALAHITQNKDWLVENGEIKWKFDTEMILRNHGIYPDRIEVTRPAISTTKAKIQHQLTTAVSSEKIWAANQGERIIREIEPSKPIPTEPVKSQSTTATKSPEPKKFTSMIKDSDLDWVKKAKQVANRYGLQTEDNLLKGGNFWILVDQNHPNYFNALKEINNLGFKMKIDKGFWKKENEPIA